MQAVTNADGNDIEVGIQVQFFIMKDPKNDKLKARSVKVTDWTPKEISRSNKKQKGGGKDDWFEDWDSWWKGKGKGLKGDGWDWDSWGKGKKRSKGDSDDDDIPLKKKKKDAGGEEPTSVKGWIKAQELLFGHMPPLPEDWIRIRSKSSGKIYQYNTETGESKEGAGGSKSLPPGWKQMTSKSTGQTYFYNTNTGESRFEEPS